MGRPELHWGERTYVMGILNVTADSFSGDGLAVAGRTVEEIVAAAVAQARAFVEAGADILDVGAESSRPRSAYGDHPDVDPEAEAALAIPVVTALVEELGDRALVSIDTSKGSVARAAVDAGARIVNDVWGARRDPGTADAAASSGAYLVLMHNQEGADYPDGVYDTVVTWLRDAVAAAEGRGVPGGRIIVDPGIGFGKGLRQNLEVIRRLGEFRVLGRPVLLGSSRKSFIGYTLDLPADQRVEGTAATIAVSITRGADIVRVHDVELMMRVVKMTDALVRRN